MQEGQWDALSDLYQRYSAGVYQLARRRLNDNQIAEDIVQEVFLRIWHYAGTWDASRGSVDTWILVIARHAIYDRLRRERQAAGIATGDQGLTELVDPDDRIEEIIALDRVNELLSHLSSEQRQVVRLVYGDGLTTERVATLLGIPLGTAKSRLRLALDHLRRELEKEAHSDGTL